MQHQKIVRMIGRNSKETTKCFQDYIFKILLRHCQCRLKLKKSF